MASADTLCKKIPNVKSTVVESHEFYIDADTEMGSDPNVPFILPIAISSAQCSRCLLGTK